MALNISTASLILNTSTTPTYPAEVSKLRGVALGFELLVCFVGLIACCIAHYCLETCKLIQSGMKIQLQILFTTDIAICLFMLPAHAAIEYRILSGIHQNKTSETVFTLLYAMAVGIERLTVMVIAIYRMMAVCYPLKYQYWSQKKVAVLVNLFTCSPVVLILAIKLLIKDDSGIEAFDPNSSLSNSFLQYGFVSAPTVITLITYLVMVLLILFKKGSISPPDSCERSVRIFILTNTLFEVPDGIMHASKATVGDAVYTIVHVIYRIHYALDPIFFVGLNARYRQMVYQCCSSSIPVREAITVTQSEVTLERI
ncbi:uncharacterized protein LOC125039645 [Penaeus chinensis]|uniref:uncharacterized protein LOC125039645 n=1 Tax=Penaeus chinensis TaxID=139456 RepID=UPI001FB5D126|nr:uncharacterized protein LOC125039645 [Penaeus chinensis]